MAAITFTLKGADTIRRNLAQLSDAMQRRIMAASMRKGMNDVLKPAVVAASPAGKTKRKKARKTRSGATLGPLKKAWQTRLVRTAQGVHMQLAPLTRTRDAFYAKFIEMGWLAGRRISKREARAIERGTKRFRRRTPVPARPFAGPAANASFGLLTDAIAAQVASRIETEMSKKATR